MLASLDPWSYLCRVTKHPEDISAEDLQFLVRYIALPIARVSLGMWDALGIIFEELVLHETDVSALEERFIVAFALRFDSLFVLPEEPYHSNIMARVSIGTVRSVLEELPPIAYFTEEPPWYHLAIRNKILVENPLEMAIDDLIDAMTLLPADIQTELGLHDCVLDHPFFTTCSTIQYRTACEVGLNTGDSPMWKSHIYRHIEMHDEVREWEMKTAAAFAVLGADILVDFPEQLQYVAYSSPPGTAEPVWTYLADGVRKVCTPVQSHLVSEPKARASLLNLMTYMLASGHPDAVESGLLIPSIMLESEYTPECIDSLCLSIHRLNKIFN